MKVMIVGSAGQVGQELVKRAPSGWEILATDRSQLDITDAQQVNRLVSSFCPHVIINAAAYTAVDKAELEPALAFAINRDGPKYLARAAKVCGAKIIHISTDYVFPGDKSGLYMESDATGPTGVYGLSKLEGELAIAQECSEHIILRTAWVFGEHGHNFVKTIIRLASERTKLSVVGDQFGSPTYAGDIADSLLTIARKVTCKSDSRMWGIYHFSGTEYVCWADFAIAIINSAYENNLITQKPDVHAIATSQYPTPAKRPANSKLDCSKIQEIFTLKSSDWRAALKNIYLYA
ncbi:dTDP-4-dehydrorhamnose reductase [Serratia grimesii]|uniref:dTDP-4-dehydrorhamnose reductase n=1 Tax=Serratia grimesii TaxID=82995 RepID=UPI00076F3924|nr:dTDP-4-dehydrorhamnose reductase [Serratia grimesii]CUW09720.1 dTDP-4-dehydrorhamnose reductase [Serratia grimesii]SMZ55950.1 dTDP-4-dehydrorhamnose reductase [Serratia grimesii]